MRIITTVKLQLCFNNYLRSRNKYRFELIVERHAVAVLSLLGRRLSSDYLYV